MNATDIRRVTTADLEHPKSPRAELAVQASEKLGYTRLANCTVTNAPLMEAMVNLDILPLKTSDVERYKKSKERDGMWSGHKMAIVAACSFAICVPVFSKLIVLTTTGTYSPIYVMTIIGMILTALLGVLSLILGLVHALDENQKGKKTIWRWQTASLVSYGGIVPDFVLNKALQIRDAYPDAQFMVTYLAEREEKEPKTLRVDPDPFLVVFNGKETYYLDVWDERDFEHTL
jgi:hypothetical protein